MWIIRKISEENRCMHTFQGEQPQLYASVFGVAKHPRKGLVDLWLGGMIGQVADESEKTDKQPKGR